jgi:hypothetical protein
LPIDRQTPQVSEAIAGHPGPESLAAGEQAQHRVHERLVSMAPAARHHAEQHRHRLAAKAQARRDGLAAREDKSMFQARSTQGLAAGVREEGDVWLRSEP